MSTNKSRSKSALLNMAFNFAYQIINTLINIIIPPLIIGKFGSTINGLISTIKQILGYVQLLGAGISEATVVSLYKPIAKNDTYRISSIYNACSITFTKSGTLFSITAVLIAFIYPFFINEKFNYYFLVLLILILSIAGISEFFVIGKCRSLLMADQKFYIVNIAQIVGAVGNLLITILLIYLDSNILLIQLGSSIIYAMRLIILYLYVKEHYSFLDSEIEPNFQAINKRKSATIHQLAGLITFGSQTIFVSIFCGLAEASVYSVYNLVFTGINTLLSTVSSALLASFGNIIAQDDEKKLNDIFSIYERIYYILVFCLYTVTYVMFLSFINLYTSNVTDINYSRIEYVVLFCIMGIVNCLRTPGSTIINAAGHYRETQNRAIIEMIICFVLECLLVKDFGGIGILIATIVAYFYRSIDVIYYSNKIILKRKAIISVSIILYNIIIYLIFILSSKFYIINPLSYFDWILDAIVISLVVFTVYIVLNFFISKLEYNKVINKIRRK